MLKIKIFSLVVGVFAICLTASAKTDTSKLNKELNSELNSELKALAESAAIPGLSAGVVEKDKPTQLIALGLANSENQLTVKHNTLFQAASLSKPVLAYIVLRLAERGDITLDQPLYQMLENPRIADKAWAKLLTPRLVLSHQTGLPNWGRGELKFKFKPGSDFGYSGEGYVYLQQVLEKLTGLSYQQLAEREVFKPLKMRDSYFTWTKDDKLTLAQGHDRTGKQVKRDIPKANAAASLHTTPADYLKFIQAWFDVQNLKPKSRQLAFAVQTAKDAESKTPIGWGLGWGIYYPENKRIAWHWGDNGVFRAFTAIDVHAQKGFVYFTNSENGLAIAKQMTEKVLPGNTAISDWLGYGQADSPLWQAERMGYEMIGKGQYAKATEYFEQVLKQYPDNRRLSSKVKWMKPLIEKPKNKLELSEQLMAKLAGQYGDRKLFVEKGALKYQRNEGDASTLKPFYDNVFKVGDAEGFRLEVVFDENNQPVKLKGLYDSGYSDESVRSGN